jgi:hypothetical protein
MGSGRGYIRGKQLQNATLLHVRAARLCRLNESSCGAMFVAMMQTSDLRQAMILGGLFIRHFHCLADLAGDPVTAALEVTIPMERAS